MGEGEEEGAGEEASLSKAVKAPRPMRMACARFFRTHGHRHAHQRRASDKPHVRK